MKDVQTGRILHTSPNEKLHIIWDITARCGYNCKICATRDDNRKELTYKEKQIVLVALSKERDRIKLIDFAGGDPCTDSESRDIIAEAISIFGQDLVSVTTTAKGINGLSQNEKYRILKNCEITIDASHESLINDVTPNDEYKNHRGNNYSRNNRDNIPFFSDVVKHLTINIPVLDADLSAEEIERLIHIIHSIQSENQEMFVETHVIRLMRVGNSVQNNDIESYKLYDPIDKAQIIFKELEKSGIKSSYHCSLRLIDALSEQKCYCTMLRNKIGIDCAGNVFACAWGGYLNATTVNKNPFYLGNLLEQDLESIIDKNTSENFKRISNLVNGNLGVRYCPVASIACAGRINENQDPLALKYNNASVLYVSAEK